MYTRILSSNLYFSCFCKETRIVSVLVVWVKLADFVSVKLKGRLMVGQGDAGKVRRGGGGLFLCVGYM